MLAFKVYYERDEKNNHKQKYQMLTKAIGPTSATAPKAQGLLDPCFKCGQKGHRPGLTLIPMGTMAMFKVLSRRTWSVDFPHPSHGMKTSNTDCPPADLLGLAIELKGSRLS